MSIVVTGAGGFVGQHVVKLLLSEKYKVLAVDAVEMPIPQHPDLKSLVADLSNIETLQSVITPSVEAIIHLAAIPGGAAEADPKLARHVNIDATLSLIEAASQLKRAPRFVYASSIAVFGSNLPEVGINDTTELEPQLLYGMQKAMMEQAVATYSRRGSIDGVSLRLPGIVARPKTPSGLKSAFLSDVFHAVKAGDNFTCPVSETATTWLMSVEQCAKNILHGVRVAPRHLPQSRAITLPVIHCMMRDYVAALRSTSPYKNSQIIYKSDTNIEAGFGNWPPLSCPNAINAGFMSDGTLHTLVKSLFDTNK